MDTRLFTHASKTMMTLCFLSITSLWLYGCASMEELDTLNKTMSAHKRTTENRFQTLEKSRKQLEARYAALNKQVEESTAKVSKMNQRYQESLDDFQNQQGALSKLLDAQEAFHREGLRSVQAVRRDLASRPHLLGTDDRTESQHGLPEIALDEPLLRQ